MYELTGEKIDHMVSLGVIPSKQIFGGAKPFAFTEQGIAMLSSVLNSRRAIQVNIAIVKKGHSNVVITEHYLDGLNPDSTFGINAPIL